MTDWIVKLSKAVGSHTEVVSVTVYVVDAVDADDALVSALICSDLPWVASASIQRAPYGKVTYLQQTSDGWVDVNRANSC